MYISSSLRLRPGLNAPSFFYSQKQEPSTNLKSERHTPSWFTPEFARPRIPGFEDWEAAVGLYEPQPPGTKKTPPIKRPFRRSYPISHRIRSVGHKLTFKISTPYSRGEGGRGGEGKETAYCLEYKYQTKGSIVIAIVISGNAGTHRQRSSWRINDSGNIVLRRRSKIWGLLPIQVGSVKDPRSPYEGEPFATVARTCR